MAKSAMSVRRIMLTPDKAKEFLNGNIQNRPCNRRHVMNLAKEMKEGRWKENGDTLCYNGTTLIDGQHRCYAVIESGVSIPVILVSGLPTDVFDTKDCGKRRSASDTLSVRNEQYATLVASSLKRIDAILTRTVGVSLHYSNTEIELLLEKYPDVRASAAFIASLERKRMLPTSWMAALHYTMSKIDSDGATEFWNRLNDGVGLTTRSPLYVLREKLMSNKDATKKFNDVYGAAITIKAWNAFKEGSSIKVLRWNEGEPFPIIQ